MNPHKYVQLIFDKTAKQFNGGNGAGETEHPQENNKTQPKFQSLYKN